MALYHAATCISFFFTDALVTVARDSGRLLYFGRVIYGLPME